jgi:hypothetical protein
MQFGTLQSKIFPVYFSMQSAGAAVLYLTSPVQSPLVIWITLLLGSVGNLAVVGPWTTKYAFYDISDNSLMNTRHKLEKSSGTKYSDDNVSSEMKSLNKQFGIAHGRAQ